MKYKIEKNTVQETLIIPLYARKMCSELYPTLYYDETASELIDKINYDFSNVAEKSKSLMQRFGFFEVGGKQMKIPQRGNVIIENDVEIGANVCIDRATLGSTIIREGVKIDNLVQIAHNCDIGEHSIIVSQVGIAGSSKIGHNCVLAGQVGLSDHVVLGDRVILGGQSGVMSKVKIESNSIMLGSPAQNIDREKLKMIAEQKLPELIKLVEEKFETKIRRVK